MLHKDEIRGQTNRNNLEKQSANPTFYSIHNVKFQFLYLSISLNVSLDNLWDNLFQLINKSESSCCCGWRAGLWHRSERVRSQSRSWDHFRINTLEKDIISLPLSNWHYKTLNDPRTLICYWTNKPNQIKIYYLIIHKYNKIGGIIF